MTTLQSLAERINNALKFQKQVILQGPPGTGKTYLAKHLAKHFIELFLIKNLFCCGYKNCNCKFLGELWDEYTTRFSSPRAISTKSGRTRTLQRTFAKGGQGICQEKSSLSVVGYNSEKSKTIPLKQICDLVSENCQEIRNFAKLLECLEQIPTKRGGDLSRARDVALDFFKFLKEKFSPIIVQFHPSYTYEDFVRGITIQIEDGTPIYKARNKIFGKICEEALKNPEKIYVLIIDEINRANLPAVFGELIYALEYRGEPVEIPYEVNGKRELVVPPNLYIIGTMNTADRSIGHIDYAIRRRFIFIDVKPNKDLIEHPKARELYEKFIEKLFKEENVSPDFKRNIDDVKIGHTYFLATNPKMEEKEQIAYKFVYQVIPLLKEYEKDGILLEGKLDEIAQEVFNKTVDSIDIEDVKNFLRGS